MCNSKELLKLTPKEFQPNETNRKEITEYVIDASLCGRDDIPKIIENILSENKKIIITSITLEELDRLQFKSHDSISVAGARYILRIAAEDQKNMFKLQLVNRDYTLADDCIIEYCIENTSCCLLTSDKVMALKARVFGVESIFYPFEEKTINTNIVKFKTAQNNLETLPYSEFKNGKLWLNGNKINNSTIYQLCIDNNFKPMKRNYRISVGSILFEAKHIKDRIWGISKYVVVNETVDNNAEKVFFKEIAFLDDYSFEKTDNKLIDSFLRSLVLIMESNDNATITLPYTKFDKETNSLITNSHVTKGQAVLVYKQDKIEDINNSIEIELEDYIIVISLANEKYTLSKFTVTSISNKNNCKCEIKVEGFVKNENFQSTDNPFLDDILAIYLPQII